MTDQRADYYGTRAARPPQPAADLHDQIVKVRQSAVQLAELVACRPLANRPLCDTLAASVAQLLYQLERHEEGTRPR